MSLKIIAIRTGKNNETSYFNFLKGKKVDVKVDYLKNLKPNNTYSFNSNYSFNNDFTEITYEPQNDIDLYSLKLDGRKNPLDINISAIVGENGCGKSTLIELLYWMNYNIGCFLELFEDKRYQPYPYLDVQLLYCMDKEHRILRFSESKEGGKASISVLKFKIENGRHKVCEEHWEDLKEKKELTDFFYSIVINYSLYALNSEEIGIWINPLFHKNDGYQTPIVLNPMKKDGNIDVNKERRLLSRRLQSNIFEPIKGNIKDSLRNLANGKVAKTLNIEYDRNYKHEKKDYVREKEIIKSLKSVFDIDELPEYSMLQDAIISYISTKLQKMSKAYPTIYGSSSIEEQLKKIKDTKSHTAFKIKGAILHLKYHDEIYGKLAKFTRPPISLNVPFIIDIDDYSKLIEEVKKKEKDFYVNTYMMAFPTFFTVNIMPLKEDKSSKKSDELSMDTFSSGEKQRINGLSSIVYHIININSVEEQENKDFISYKYINIILDEIELYYHPEWQRTFISDLLEYLNKINPDNLSNIEGINIVFITHSPFILSDVLNCNIMYLKEGKQIDHKNYINPFGANINDILKQSFFLENGFMGAFAQQKISEVVDAIDESKINTDNYNQYKKIIDLIGDPIIRQELFSFYSDKTENRFEKIAQLEKELEELKAKK